MIAATLSFRLNATACQPSYPRNSENANPPGTFTVYLSRADIAKPPKTTSHTVAIPMINMLFRLIAAPPVLGAPSRMHFVTLSRVGLHRIVGDESIGRW